VATGRYCGSRKRRSSKALWPGSLVCAVANLGFRNSVCLPTIWASLLTADRPGSCENPLRRRVVYCIFLVRSSAICQSSTPGVTSKDEIKALEEDRNRAILGSDAARLRLTASMPVEQKRVPGPVPERPKRSYRPSQDGRPTISHREKAPRLQTYAVPPHGQHRIELHLTVVLPCPSSDPDPMHRRDREQCPVST